MEPVMEMERVMRVEGWGWSSAAVAMRRRIRVLGMVRGRLLLVPEAVVLRLPLML